MSCSPISPGLPVANPIDIPECCSGSSTPCADCTGTQPDALMVSTGPGCTLAEGTYAYVGYTNLGGGSCRWTWFNASAGASIEVLFFAGAYYCSACSFDGATAQPLICLGGFIQGTIHGAEASITFD